MSLDAPTSNIRRIKSMAKGKNLQRVHQSAALLGIKR